jgi:hypothetical protein
MKGESLYEVYREEVAKAGNKPIPTWDLLFPEERTGWNELAKFLTSRMLIPAGYPG